MKNYLHSLFASITLGTAICTLMLPTPSQGATAPSATTLTASNVTAAAATLRGTVNPGSATTTAWFEWGPGNVFKFKTASTNLGSGAGALAFSTSVTGLTAGLTYHYRAVASNSVGIIRGMALPFGVPTVTLSGAALQTNLLGNTFIDQGATATGLTAAIATGDSFTLALKADGQVVGWGLNTEGQTNIPSAATNIIAIAAGYVHGLAARADGSVLGLGTNSLGQLDIPPDATNVVALAAGFAHSLALRSDGTVVSWGADDFGQVTVPEDATNVVAIAAGYTHSLALRSDGHVVQWGEFPSGPVDPPPQATNVIAIAAGYSHSLALRANGTVVAWGGEAPQIVAVPASVTNVIAIAAGYGHSFALRANGTLVGWGFNTYGEITFPGSATNIIAVGAGLGYSQALREDGIIIGWGNPNPNLGQTANPTNLTANLPVFVSGTVNMSATGNYPLLYSATNVFGFAGTATRNVLVVTPFISTRTLLGNGSFQLGMDFVPGASITIFATTDVSLPLSNWTVLGQATESPAGHYQFTDSAATSFPYRFYQARAQ